MWKYYEIYCINKTIYIKEKKVQTEGQKKKTVTTVAGTVATVRNFKKKKEKKKVSHQIPL